MILGIDTSTQVAVGLAKDGQVLATRLVGDTRSHVELLAITVAAVLGDAGASLPDVERIGVGVGPGPFTGLRVGIATAQTFGLALGVPVVGVCSLDVIALSACQIFDQPFAVALDARRHEVYWARYDASGLRVDGPRVGPPSQLPDLPVASPGVPEYPDLGTLCRLDAGVLAGNLDQLASLGLEPLYLRPPDADLPSTRKSAIVGGRLKLVSS